MTLKGQIELVAELLAKKFKTDKILLFGSYGQPTFNRDSDLDLCVIVDSIRTRKIDLIREMRREISSHLNIALDILLYEADEFQKRAALSNTLENKIVNTGMVLNG